MSEVPEADAAAAPAGKKQLRSADAGALVEGVFEVLRLTLGELLNKDKVEEAIAKARKQPIVKALLSRAKVKGAKAPKGTSLIRSTYIIFVQDCFHHLKAAGVEISLTEVGSLWKVLPEDVKAELNKRYSAVKEAYNAKIQGGETVVLADELTAYAEENEIDDVQYLELYNKYKHAVAAAKAAGGTPANGKIKAKQPAPIGALKTPTAAAAAATLAAEATKRPAEPATDDKHKHKKHKKDKKEKHAGEDAAAGEETVKKEKKEKKEKKHKKKHEKEPSESE